MTKVINLYAGPGAGKSTIAAQIFSNLKWSGINTELVTEYAKDKVWEGHSLLLQHQIYIFAKQLFRVQRLLGKVDVIVTDSPILLSLIYGNTESQEFKDLVVAEHRKMDTIDFLLERKKPYRREGRMQSEQQANIIDGQVKLLLDVLEVDYRHLVATEEDADRASRIIRDIIVQNTRSD